LVNPANLALDRNPRWSLALFNTSFAGTLHGLNAADVRSLLKHVDEDDLDHPVVHRVTDEGLRMSGDLRVPALSLQVGAVALNLTYAVIASQILPGDLMSLFLYGYEEGRRDYNLTGTIGSHARYMDIAAGYGRRFGNVSAGVALHVLLNGTVSQSRLLEPIYDAEAETIGLPYTEIQDRGGNGFAIDLGLAMEPVNRLTLSASLSNAIGGMRWGGDLYLREVTLTVEDLDPASVMTRFSASERQLQRDDLEWHEYRAATGLYEEARLPATLRAGAAYRIGWGPQIGLTYQRHLNDGWFASGWRQSLAVGIEQSLYVAAVRAGYRTDLEGGRMLAAGVSLGPLAIGGAWLDGARSGSEHGGLLLTLGMNMRGGIRSIPSHTE
jgi:hypothetical protein